MTHPDVSVILPFHDDEEIIGTAVGRIASCLRSQELRFEIVAVDDDSGDNSLALLALIRRDHPQLQIARAAARGRPYETGVGAAAGEIVWLIEPAAAMEQLGAFHDAYHRVCHAGCDLVAVDRRFVVARRSRCLEAVGDTRGLGAGFRRRLLRRARHRGLDVQASTARRIPIPRWASPLLSALSFTRSL